MIVCCYWLENVCIVSTVTNHAMGRTNDCGLYDDLGRRMGAVSSDCKLWEYGDITLMKMIYFNIELGISFVSQGN